MKLGFFTMPMHPRGRNYTQTLREDREAVILADRLGYCDAFIGEHATDACESIPSCLSFIALPALDQTYPVRPVRIIVPFAAGGSADTLIRQLTSALSEGWGQPILFDARPGATGAIGADFVARQAPEGYTLARRHHARGARSDGLHCAAGGAGAAPASAPDALSRCARPAQQPACAGHACGLRRGEQRHSQRSV